MKWKILPYMVELKPPKSDTTEPNKFAKLAKGRATPSAQYCPALEAEGTPNSPSSAHSFAGLHGPPKTMISFLSRHWH